jgi:MFS family permease
MSDKGAIRSLTSRYYVIWAFYNFGPLFILAVYPLFLRARGLDQFQINVVAAVFVLIIFLTDVPTGAFADAVGRRAAVVVGCSLHASAFAIYFFSDRYWQFILAAVIDGLGSTFGNGPIDAWAIDALDAAGFEGPKDAMFSRKFQIGQVVGVSGTLAGAYLAQLNIAAPMLVNAIAWSVTGLVAFLLMGHRTAARTDLTLAKMAQEVKRRSIDSTRLGFADRTVRLLSIGGLFSAVLWYGWGQEWQQYFRHGLDAGIGSVGWVSVGLIGAQIVGLEVAARLPGAWKHRAITMAAAAGASKGAVIVAGLASGHMMVAVAAVMIATFLEGLVGPMGFAWFNEAIAGDNRATLLSFGTTMSTVGGIIGLPLQGTLVDRLGAGITWQIVGVLSMSQVFCYLALRPRSPRETLEPGIPTAL